MNEASELEAWAIDQLAQLDCIGDCVRRVLDQLDELDPPDLDLDYVNKQISLCRQHVASAKLSLPLVFEIIGSFLTRLPAAFEADRRNVPSKFDQ